MVSFLRRYVRSIQNNQVFSRPASRAEYYIRKWPAGYRWQLPDKPPISLFPPHFHITVGILLQQVRIN